MYIFSDFVAIGETNILGQYDSYQFCESMYKNLIQDITYGLTYIAFGFGLQIKSTLFYRGDARL